MDGEVHVTAADVSVDAGADAVVLLEVVLMHFVMLMLMSVYLMNVHPGVDNADVGHFIHVINGEGTPC